MYIQGGSNMTGTDLCVNKFKQFRSYLNHLVHVYVCVCVCVCVYIYNYFENIKIISGKCNLSMFQIFQFIFGDISHPAKPWC